jgi:hypothetical protein
MEALKCRFVDKFYSDSKDTNLINELSFLFTQMDRDIWLKIRKGKMTLRQIKTRIIERMDGYRCKYREFDDIKDRLIPELQRIDEKKATKYLKAAYGKNPLEIPMTELLSEMEPWQANMRCLRSIKHLGVDLPDYYSDTRSAKRAN